MHTTNAETRPGGEPLAAELEEYRRQFERIKEDARSLVAGLSDAQFNWRPQPGAWSIAECLAHLNVAGQMYLPVVDRRIKGAREGGLVGAGPYRHGLLGKVIVRTAEPPARLKFKAPKSFTPMPEHLLSVIEPAFMSLQEQFVARLRAANGLDLGRVKVVSPASRFIRLTLGQTFALLAAHERRHLWQARQVRNHPGFPLG